MSEKRVSLAALHVHGLTDEEMAALETQLGVKARDCKSPDGTMTWKVLSYPVPHTSVVVNYFK